MKICGIYKITNIINNKSYIGQSTNVYERFAEHKRLLRLGKHPNKYIQSDYNKYGEDNFKFEVCFTCDAISLDDTEIDFIKKLGTFAKVNGYNMTLGGNSLGRGENHPLFGKKLNLSFKSRKKLSDMAKNRKCSPETREKMSKARLGKTSWNKGTKGIMKPNSGSFKKGQVSPNKGKHIKKCQ
jgi:group I intron endonuclease